MERIQPIVWNTEAFDKLVLPANRKELLQTLVEAHTKDLGFDDFVKGKGQGLVINLFGNPGVGKTLSAEAISDIIQRPLSISDNFAFFLGTNRTLDYTSSALAI